MDDDRLPKQLLYGELLRGQRKIGRPRKRFKDCLKAPLKDCAIDLEPWELIAYDGLLRRRSIYGGIQHFEAERSNHYSEQAAQKRSS